MTTLFLAISRPIEPSTQNNCLRESFFIRDCIYSTIICNATSGARPFRRNFPSLLMLITPKKMPEESPNLKLRELLNSLASSGQDAQDVEADSLAEGSALANGDLVTLLNTESGGDVSGNVLVSLLVTRVLGNKVQVLSSDDDGAVHLGGNDGTGQDTATDRDEAGERALLVDVAALNGGLGGSETQTDVLIPSSAALARSGALGLGLRVLEDVRLLLESTLRLDGQLGRHLELSFSGRYRNEMACG